MNTLFSHLLVSTRALLVSAFGPWVEIQARGLALRACPQGRLWSDTPQGRPRHTLLAGGWARNTAASLQERHSGRLLPQTSDWTRRGEASLLHCLKAQLKNQKLYKALKLQVTGKCQTRRGSHCTEAPQVRRSSAERERSRARHSGCRRGASAVGTREGLCRGEG